MASAHKTRPCAAVLLFLRLDMDDISPLQSEAVKFSQRRPDGSHTVLFDMPTFDSSSAQNAEGLSSEGMPTDAGATAASAVAPPMIGASHRVGVSNASPNASLPRPVDPRSSWTPSSQTMAAPALCASAIPTQGHDSIPFLLPQFARPNPFAPAYGAGVTMQSHWSLPTPSAHLPMPQPPLSQPVPFPMPGPSDYCSDPSLSIPNSLVNQSPLFPVQPELFHSQSPRQQQQQQAPIPMHNVQQHDWQTQQSSAFASLGEQQKHVAGSALHKSTSLGAKQPTAAVFDDKNKRTPAAIIAGRARKSDDATLIAQAQVDALRDGFPVGPIVCADRHALKNILTGIASDVFLGGGGWGINFNTQSIADKANTR